MKKIITILLSITFLALAAIPCFAAKDPALAGWQRYKIKELGMSLLLPPNTQIYTREMADTEKYPDTPKEVVNNFDINPTVYFQVVNTDLEMRIDITKFAENVPYKNLKSEIVEQAYLEFMRYSEPESEHNYTYTPYWKFLQASPTVINETSRKAVVFEFTTLINYNAIALYFYCKNIIIPEDAPLNYMNILDNIKVNEPLSWQLKIVLSLCIIVIFAIICYLIDKSKHKNLSEGANQ